MRLVVAAVSMLVGAAMLLPAATALPAFATSAPSASVAPSAILEPSGPPLPDAMVELNVGSETEPTRNWTIAVTGGVPSVDVLTVPDPTFGSAEFAVSMFEQSATVELTATLQAGSRLTAGTCNEDNDPMDRDVLVAPRQLVFEVVPGVVYECFYASASDSPQSSAEIVAHKIIDVDGSLDTVDDQSSGEGWEFDLELADGTIDEPYPVTNSDGLAGWLISFGPGGTSATLTEAVHGDFELLDAFCMKVADSGDEPVGEFNGDSITFQIEEGGFASYQCSFINVPADTGLAEISVWKHIDADGDFDTSEDHEWPPSWRFEAAFEDDVEIVFADPDTDRDEPARWVVRLAGDSTRVVVTEVPQDGYRLSNASCIDADSSDGAEIPTTLEGNSLSFDVSGFGPILELGPHPYFCDFRNTPVGGAALPTVPPTHAAMDSAVIESAPWHLVLVGLAALIASLLVLGSRPATPRRH